MSRALKRLIRVFHERPKKADFGDVKPLMNLAWLKGQGLCALFESMYGVDRGKNGHLEPEI